ncbi:MAG TPA: dihydrolipoamide acetyltransferase family protein [Candidatus Eremiobacteraceae bacterium]|nr:dihydrolipoamide acetyltransferase family protein [Candidatus Eremiobacteraceae bacterium]
MAIELEMPELAESVIEGEIVKWLVNEGDRVEQDQPLVEVMTDKVTVEIPSPHAGILLKQVAKEGDVVPIGKPIAIFGEPGEKIDDTTKLEHVTPKVDAVANGKVDAAASSAKSESPKAEPAKAETARPEQPKPQPVAASETASLSSFGKPMAAPAIRKLARELGVELTKVRGSGENGRIGRADVERVAKAGKQAPSEAASYSSPKPTSTLPERIPLRGLRRNIAQHMVHSKHTAAHTLQVDEADMTELVRWRSRSKEKAAERGVKLTYLPFFVKAAAASLKKYPFVNASLDDAASEIVLKKDYNIGIAVDTDAGLVVPVIHNADRLSIFDLARAIAGLADKARHGKLSHDEITGGTFTITNVGSVGGLFTFPVINHPEVAIMGTHSIQERPVVRDGQIVIRSMAYLSLGFDHRVVDGALAARFLREIADLLANPEILLMEGI